VSRVANAGRGCLRGLYDAEWINDEQPAPRGTLSIYHHREKPTGTFGPHEQRGWLNMPFL
jgi:hypothetical protein